MRKDEKVRPVLILFIYRFQVGIQLRTNTGAGSEEKFCQINFSGYLFIGDPDTILIQERKGLYFIYYGHAGLSISGDDFGKQEIEPDNKSEKKQDVEPDFFGHIVKLRGQTGSKKFPCSLYLCRSFVHLYSILFPAPCNRKPNFMRVNLFICYT